MKSNRLLSAAMRGIIGSRQSSAERLLDEYLAQTIYIHANIAECQADAIQDAIDHPEKPVGGDARRTKNFPYLALTGGKYYLSKPVVIR
jgi:hypothetical protein